MRQKSTLGKEAAIAGLRLPLSYYEELRKLYTRKRDLFLSYLDKAELKYTKPQGAYYVLVDISEFDGSNDTRVCEWLTKEVKVATLSGSSFFHEKVD
ncbi:MAG: aminotransferase class I/II-fold pyridoxal phosphate-dependent enzyme, partial [Sphaerochaetaceae bacterium]